MRARRSRLRIQKLFSDGIEQWKRKGAEIAKAAEEKRPRDLPFAALAHFAVFAVFAFAQTALNRNHGCCLAPAVAPKSAILSKYSA